MKKQYTFSYLLVCMLMLSAQVGSATTFTVTTTADDGIGSLREAIVLANSNAGADVIEFSVAGTLTLLLSGLPSITDALTIDGTTAPGYYPTETPTFIIDGDFTVFTANNPTDLTIQGLDLSKSGAQGGTGFDLYVNAGTVTIQNCKVNNRHRGIVCIGNANWTVTGNDLTASGLSFENPALYFHTVSTGTIVASNNLFGGTGANTALRLHDCSGKIIGDENASPAAADIVIKDTDGLLDLTGDGISIFTSACSNLTFDNLDVSKPTGLQSGTGLYIDNSTSGNMTVKNCTAKNRQRGVICIGNVNWTVMDNDLTTSGYDFNSPALYFLSVTTGTIAASGNLFGGENANSALRLYDCSNKIIGDETASPPADIVIKDTDGLLDLTGNDISIFTLSCSNLTFDNLDVSKLTGLQSGTGLYIDNSSGNITVKNCTAKNRQRGIVCIANADWTVTGNDLTTSGYDYNSPALYFLNVTTGTIAASDNLFGGADANVALRLHACSGKIIGDENASPAADIVIKDSDGLTNLTGGGISIYVTDCSNLTFDGLDLSKQLVPVGGVGIQLDNCSSTIALQNLTVSKRSEGIVLNSPLADFTVTCSAIYRNSTGIRVYNAQSATISNNTFKENTYRSVLNSSATPVNAENNYWLNPDGSTTPADATNGYNGDVDADPALLAAAGCAPALPAPVRYYVDVDATGANNGTSWMDAFTSLQSAVDRAYSGDEIWVAEGTYYPTSGNFQGAFFSVNGGVKLYGGFDGTEADLTNRVLAGNETILSGDIGNAGDASDNSDILMAIISGAVGTRVDGFTFSDADNGYTSGALNLGIGTVDVANCIFRNNTAYVGGGMHLGSGTVNLDHCLFHDNYGGAGGGAIASGDATLVATNCIFRNNTGGDSGGAFFSQAGPHATFSNCLFYGQRALNYDGSVIFSGGTINLDHCTVTGNTNRRALALLGIGNVKNCILWNNPSGDLGGNNLAVSYTINQSGFSGDGNSTADPLFTNAADPDGADDVFGTSDDGLVPSKCSPAIDGANTPSPTLDLAGNPRVDAPVIGVSPADMGAFEQQDVNYPVVITDIVMDNISALLDNGTICTADDSFTGDVTVTFTNITSIGTLDLTGDILTPVTPVPIANTTTTTTHTFTGVTFKASGQTTLTASFSDAPCSYTETNSSTPSAGIGNVECVTCGTKWYDDGGPTGDYTQGVIKTFCPQTTERKAQLDFVSVELSDAGWDALYIYNGTNFSAGQLGRLDSNTPSGTFTATEANPTGCLMALFEYSNKGEAPGWEANFNCVRIFNIAASNISGCNGANTSCTTDDIYTADLTVSFASKPASGMLTLSGADIIGGPLSVPVGGLTGNTYTFTGVMLRADGAASDVFASFSDEPTDVFTKNIGDAPNPCSIVALPPPITASVTVSGITDCTQFNGTYNYAFSADWNGHHWVHASNPNIVAFYYDEGEFYIYDSDENEWLGYVLGTEGIFPCSGWEDYDCDVSGMVVTGDCNMVMPLPNEGTSVTVSGIDDCSEFNGTYNIAFDWNWNGLHWVHATNPNIVAFYYDPGEFYLYDDDSGYSAGYVYGTSNIFPCTDWEDYDCDVSQIVVSGDCGLITEEVTCNIAAINLADLGACNDNGTTTAADDYFTADVTVHFAYAPGSGNLTLKQGTSVVAEKSAADLECVTTWTFENAHLLANGSEIFLTAEFGSECSFTSASLGMAPASCSCVPPTFTTCPTNQTANTPSNACAIAVNYTAMAGGSPASTLSYVFTGMTTGSGSGTGSGTVFNRGVTNVVITATNDCGTPTCAFTVTVTDNIPPSITCPGNIALNTAAGQCGNTATWTAPVGTDNCTGANTSASHMPGALFTKGQTTVTYTVTDGANLTSACSFTVTISDGQNPSIVCPMNISRNADPGQCSSVVSYANPSYSDNCGAVLTLTSPANTASGSVFPRGITMVNWKAVDAAGNEAICGFTVTVIYTQSPTITCPPSMSKATDAGACTAAVTYATPTSSDNCGPAPVSLLSGLASGSAFPKGTNIVTWQTTVNGGATCSFTVTVTDGQVPTITCPANQTKNTDAGLCTAVVTYATPTATDNCTPAPTVTIQSGLASGADFPKGVTTVTWKAADGANLTKTCSFRVTVNDSEGPTISCPASQSVNTSGSSCSSAVITYTTPTATDNCMTPAPTVTKVSGPASGSTFPRGSTNVTWRATDGAGKIKTCSFSVTVTDNVLPGITCPANIAVTAAAGQCSAVATYASPTATDNCGVASLLLLIGSASGSTFPQGVTTNTWRAMDDSGLTATCSFTVTVSCGTGAQGGDPEERQAVQGSKTRTVSDLTLALAPNPAAEQTVISITGLGETGGHLSVHDAQGRLMWRQEVDGSVVGSQQCTVRLEGFAAGLYFVTLRSEGQVVTRRLAVERW